MALHVLGWWMATSLYASQFWVMEKLHTGLEVGGMLLALIVAYWVYALGQTNLGPKYGVRISAALIAMAILDGFHAFSEIGHLFVWFHSAAILVGGLLFASVWLPFEIERRLGLKTLGVISLLIIGIGLGSQLYRDAIPEMVINGHFTALAVNINLVGGILLLIASVRFILTYRATKNVDDLLFFLHTALFGMAALMFEKSHLWDFSWWTWHVLRFVAFLVAFWFVFVSQQRLFDNLKSSEQKLKNFNDELKQGIASQTKILKDKNELLEQYTSLVSHDLKEPLRSIVSLSSILEDKYATSLDDKGKQIISYISESAARMDKLVTELTIQGKIGMNEPPKLLDAAKMVKEVLVDLNQMISESKAEIEVENLPQLTAYDLELRLLFQNLINNAIKYQPKGHIPKVEIACEEFDAYYKFSIRDNGIGINATKQLKVFELFTRLHGKGQYEGLGIGLSHCKRVVELHEGNIWVVSVEGRGSVFYFTLSKKVADHIG